MKAEIVVLTETSRSKTPKPTRVQRSTMFIDDQESTFLDRHAISAETQEANGTRRKNCKVTIRIDHENLFVGTLAELAIILRNAQSKDHD